MADTPIIYRSKIQINDGTVIAFKDASLNIAFGTLSGIVNNLTGANIPIDNTTSTSIAGWLNEHDEVIAYALNDLNERIGDGLNVADQIEEAINGNNDNYLPVSSVIIPNATPVGVHGEDIILGTIGATSIKIQLPEDNNNKVEQKNTNVSTSYPIILKSNTTNIDTTDTVNYNTKLNYNPGSDLLTVGTVNATNATILNANIPGYIKVDDFNSSCKFSETPVLLLNDTATIIATVAGTPIKVKTDNYHKVEQSKIDHLDAEKIYPLLIKDGLQNVSTGINFNEKFYIGTTIDNNIALIANNLEVYRTLFLTEFDSGTSYYIEGVSNSSTVQASRALLTARAIEDKIKLRIDESILNSVKYKGTKAALSDLTSIPVASCATGDLYFVGSNPVLEYIWDGSTWEELGNEQTFVPESSVSTPDVIPIAQFNSTVILGTVSDKTFRFKMPAEPENTDYKVQQSPITTNAEFPILFKSSSAGTLATTTTAFKSTLKYNPSTDILTVPNANITSATVTTLKSTTGTITNLISTNATINIATLGTVTATSSLKSKSINASTITASTITASTNNSNTTNSTTVNATTVNASSIPGFVKTEDLVLGTDYSMSTSVNEDLELAAGDTYENAFAKLHKAIIDDEEIVAAAINELDEKKVNSESLSNVAISGQYDDLLNVPASLSDFANDLELDMTYVAKTSVSSQSVTGSFGAKSILGTVDGKTFSITLPATPSFSDTKVTQSSVTASGNYPIILKKNTGGTNTTDTVNYNTNLTYNPGNNTLTVGTISGINATLTNLKATTGNIVTVNSTTVNASTVTASTITGINATVTNLKATTGNIETINSTTVNATTINASSIPGFVKLEDLALSSEYVQSASSNLDLALKPLDSYETAFAKLHKALEDDEEVITAALNDLNERIGVGLTVAEQIQNITNQSDSTYVSQASVIIPDTTPVGVHGEDIILGTIGATSIKLHLPSVDTDTNDKVEQISIATAGNYPIILKKNTGGTNTTDTVNYNTNLTYNPGNDILTVGTISGTNATVTNLKATTANIVTVNATTINSTTVNASTITASTISGTNATVTNLKATTGNIGTVNASTINASTITGGALNNYVTKTDIAVSLPHATLDWNSITTIATIAGTTIKVKMPEQPDVNKVNQSIVDNNGDNLPILLNPTEGATGLNEAGFSTSFFFETNAEELFVPRITVSATVNSAEINATTINSDAISIYGVSTTAAATVTKVVSIPSIKTLNVGQLIIIKPTVTSTVANSKIKLNNFAEYPMMRNGAAITTTTDSYVWNASYPSIWVFDGTNWQWLGGYDLNSNTTYSALTQAALNTGTETTGRTITAKLLRDNFYTEDEVDNLVKLPEDYVAATDTGAALEPAAGDTFADAIAKLHKSLLDFEYVVAAALNDINSRLNKLNV